MNQVKLLVTGLCGRLGRAVTAEVLSRGWKIVGLDQAPWPDPAGPPAGVELHAGSLDDTALLDRLMADSTHFIHTAGLHGENLKDHGLAEFLRSNVETVGNLIEQCAARGIRNICLSSTMEVQIGRDYAASGATVLDEESPIKTDSIYSLSKALMERLAAERSRHLGISISVMRYMAFGYRKDERLGLGLLSRYLSARDAARAAIQGVLAEGLRGEIFNIGPKSPLTNQDILQALKAPAEVLERHFPGCLEIIEKAGQPLSPDMFWPVTSVEKARRLLDWEPQYTFASWLEAHGWKQPPTS
jgi:nucleoside-diphosphate-sugar epimerase